MKKKSLKKVFSALMAAGVLSALVFSLAACSPEGGEASKPSTSSSAMTSSKTDTSSKEDTSSKGESKAPTNGKFASMQEFVDSDTFQSQIKPIKQSVEGSGMKVDITGEDNKLIFAFQLNEQVDKATNGPALEAALEQMGSSFEPVASVLKEGVDVENPIIVVKYLNKDGSELASKEFTAK